MVIAQGRKQEGAQSASYYVLSAGALGGTVVDGVNTDWDALPSGKLKDVLNRTYVATDDNTDVEVFAAAWAAAGGSFSADGVGTPAGDHFWDLTEEGFPTVNYSFSVAPSPGASALALRISVSYSASE